MIPALRQYLPHCTKRVGVSVISMSTWAVFVLGPYVYVRVCSRPYEKDLVPHPVFVGNQVNIISLLGFFRWDQSVVSLREMGPV